jgi:Ulp1 family protease
LLGASIYIQSSDKTSWNKAMVMESKSEAPWILVRYLNGTACQVNVGPGGQAWGLAPIHAALHATLNRKGTKRLDQYQQGNSTDIIVSVSLNRDKRSFCTMQRFEMRCFAPGTWLNATAMEICTSMLCNTGTCRVAHQGFYRKLVHSSPVGSDHCNPVYTADLKKWFSNAAAMWLKDTILVVVNLQCHSTPDDPWHTALGNHWVLATVDLKHHTFRYYDPMGQHDRQELHNEQMSQCIANLKMWLQAEHLSQHAWVSDHSGQPDSISSPLQGNSFDCGVFTILAALCEALAIPLGTFPWGQQHAAKIRTQLAALILK